MKDGYKKTELGWIPEEWKTTTIGKCGEVFGGNAFKSTKFKIEKSNYSYQVIRMGNVQQGKLDLDRNPVYLDLVDIDSKDKKYILNETDVLISLTGTVNKTDYGNVSWVDKNYNYLLNQRVACFRSDSTEYLSRYYYYLMQGEKFREQFFQLGVGGTGNQANVSISDFNNIKVFKIPLKEQQKIAEILSNVDSQIDDTDKLIEKTKELKKGLMQRLLTKGIGHTEFKITEIGEIPVDWEVDKFKNITDILRCGVASTPTYVDKGVPFLSAQNIQDGKLSLHKFNLISEEYHGKLTKNDKPQYGDILYSRVGANYGIAAVVNIDFEFSVYVSLTLIRMKQGYDSEFFKYLLNSTFCKRQADIGVFQGAGVPNLNVKIVEEFNMIVPPLEEQKQIAKILLSVDIQIEEYENKKSKLEELKRGLMQQLLTGKIRVI